MCSKCVDILTSAGDNIVLQGIFCLFPTSGKQDLCLICKAKCQISPLSDKVRYQTFCHRDYY